MSFLTYSKIIPTSFLTAEISVYYCEFSWILSEHRWLYLFALSLCHYLIFSKWFPRVNKYIIFVSPTIGVIYQ